MSPDAEYVARLEDALRQILGEATEQGGGDYTCAPPAWQWAAELVESVLGEDKDG